MRAFSPALPPARRIRSWNPSRIRSLRQRFLDVLREYYSSTLDSYPILTPEESGTVAVPRGGRCFLFDGSDDYGAVADGSALISGTGDFTVTAWINTATVASGTAEIIGNYDAVNATGFELYRTTNKIGAYIGSSLTGTTTIAADTWYHVAAVRESGVLKLYVNGSLDASGTRSSSIGGSGPIVVGGLPGYRAERFQGKMRDLRAYNVAKSAAEVLAIYNQPTTPSVIDRTGLLAGWWCESESGTTEYDWSGNGKHLTLVNTTSSTFHAVDSGVTYSAANELGYTLSGSVVVPRNESDHTKDASGSSLQYSGPIKLPATTEVPCVTGDGSAAYVEFGTQLIPSSADFSLTAIVKPNGADAGVAWLGQGSVSGASFYTVSDGHFVFFWLLAARIDIDTGSNPHGKWFSVSLSRVGNLYSATVTNLLTGVAYSGSATVSGSFDVSNTMLLGDRFGSRSTGSVSSFSITTGGVTKYVKLQEGPGADSTNRTVYVVGSDGSVSTGSIVGGTVANIWANRCPYGRDHQLEYGGRLTTQNLLTYSNYFGNGAWTGTFRNVTNNASIAPDGTLTADKVVPSTTNNYHTVLQNLAGGLQTFSVYAKDAGYSIWLQLGGSNGCTAFFDLSAGTFANNGTFPATFGTGSTQIAKSITAIGSGWYRCSLTASIPGTADSATVGIAQSSSVASYAGDGTSGVYLWQARLKNGVDDYVDTSDIDQPTTSVAVPSGIFIPALLDGSACADGRAITLPAGTSQNPGTRILPNLWNAPSLVRLGYNSSTKLAVGDVVQTIDPDDTKFAAANGSRYFVSDVPLTGSELTNAEAYVS